MTTNERFPKRADVTCGRCGLTVEPSDGYVIYHEAGGREAGSKTRIVAHGTCITDEIAEGRLVRVSGFAFEPAPSLD